MNTKNQVPETVPSAYEQLAWLREHLAGSRAFADCRGKFGHTVEYLVSHMAKGDSSTDDYEQRLRVRLGSVRVMAVLIQRLFRRGWNVAFSELMSALENECYVLTGEIVPIERIIPVTFVMYEPDKTLAMLRWMFTHPLSDLDCLGHMDVRPALLQKVSKLLMLFPVLDNYAFSRRKNDLPVGMELYLSHKEEVLDRFTIPQRAIPMGLNWDYQQPMMKTMLRYERQSNQGMTHPFAFLFRGWDQRRVLELYPREVQDHIATWQFHLPVVFKDIDTTHILVGLHCEDEHQKWLKCHPTYASKGVAQGMGGLVIPLRCPTERYEEYAPDPKQYLAYGFRRFILKRSSDHEWRWDWRSEQED